MDTPRELIRKYNVATPRYTSYPTVPFWDKTPPTLQQWSHALEQAIGVDRHISLYIHLPFCESLCTFCGCNKRITKNHGVEVPYLQTLWKEWQMYVSLFGQKLSIKEIHFGGGTPTFFSPEHLAGFLRQLFGSADIPSAPVFGFEAHPATTTPEHLAVLRDFGFTRVSFGVQDVSEEVTNIIRRKQTREQIVRMTACARAYGYTSINYDLVYGLPAQTPDSMRQTIELVRECKPERIALYSFAFVPWLHPSQQSFTKYDLPDNDQKLLLYQIAKEQLRAEGYVEVGMDHFALPTDPLCIAQQDGTLHRNFMGYTPAYAPVNLALGASSISDAWSAFVQNEKVVEQYQQIVNEQNTLPISKGHLLTAEDLCVRKHILALMCRLATSFPAEQEEIWNIVLPRLLPLREDGLCSIDNDSREVSITEAGRPFMRNICMAFDLRMANEQTQTQQIFSRSI